ncbi:helix-turn-helix domain-containing protein [Dyadobacter tibetensis]|uniref:helix-turn-helix domain-containing protein n=1 Tax=Dyadobacter tibetensis TaxID=1211851 RepID=UPI0004722374|nr:helix-turn-helix transcriptional regulator [Dyadobacter tibetensis]
MKIGHKLRRLRQYRRFSTRELADLLGIGQNTYVSWELDKTYPSFKYFVPLAEALGLCPISLMAFLFEQISLEELLMITETVPDLKEAVIFYKNHKDKLTAVEHSDIREELLRLNHMIQKSTLTQSSE